MADAKKRNRSQLLLYWDLISLMISEKRGKKKEIEKSGILIRSVKKRSDKTQVEVMGRNIGSHDDS